jgi:hypothetical protein
MEDIDELCILLYSGTKKLQKVVFTCKLINHPDFVMSVNYCQNGFIKSTPVLANAGGHLQQRQKERVLLCDAGLASGMSGAPTVYAQLFEMIAPKDSSDINTYVFVLIFFILIFFVLHVADL